jgi:hypothetical protein
MACLARRIPRIFALASVLGMAAAGLAAATPANAATTAIPAINHAAIPSTHRPDPFFIQNSTIVNGCLGITGDDKPVTMQGCLGGNAVTWSKGALGGVVEDPYGNYIPAYQVINKDNSECLGILGNSTKEGAGVYSWGCNGEANQYWALDTDIWCFQATTEFHPYYNLNDTEVLGIEVNGEGVETLVQWDYQPSTVCTNQFWDLTGIALAPTGRKD